ncbi:hypothetical protein IHC87_10770 [Photobacterium damselae subsp. damselae]|uniref:hypothetical protein n=1 Tax=Photobacterium damselae TaxID=38293 RepID=UPI001F3EAC79|nr:hypothetical protein [Photobacterium damselae]UJZ93138.1 hypothetical protein IHC87_10770 [Photobacterium damselae subsp. damselae]UJZ97121.1 hypothetical protein IHC88_10750 [Photobacterium damselae subsp. damselae]
MNFYNPTPEQKEQDRKLKELQIREIAAKEVGKQSIWSGIIYPLVVSGIKGLFGLFLIFLGMCVTKYFPEYSSFLP